MGKASRDVADSQRPDSLIEVFGGPLIAGLPERRLAAGRLAHFYGGDVQGIFHHARAAYKQAEVKMPDGSMAKPDRHLVRRDFSHWLQLHHRRLEQDPALALRVQAGAALLEDNSYLLMMAELGYGGLLPADGSPSALMRMCERPSARAEDLQYFLEQVDGERLPALLNYQSRSGHTALMAAACNRDAQGLIPLLIEAGADATIINRPYNAANQPNKSGWRAAHYAVNSENAPAVAELRTLAPQTFDSSPASPVPPDHVPVGPIQEALRSAPAPAHKLN